MGLYLSPLPLLLWLVFDRTSVVQTIRRWSLVLLASATAFLFLPLWRTIGDTDVYCGSVVFRLEDPLLRPSCEMYDVYAPPSVVGFALGIVGAALLAASSVAGEREELESRAF